MGEEIDATRHRQFLRLSLETGRSRRQTSCTGHGSPSARGTASGLGPSNAMGLDLVEPRYQGKSAPSASSGDQAPKPRGRCEAVGPCQRDQSGVSRLSHARSNHGSSTRRTVGAPLERCRSHSWRYLLSAVTDRGSRRASARSHEDSPIASRCARRTDRRGVAYLLRSSRARGCR